MNLKKVSLYLKYAPAGLPLYSLSMVSVSIILFIVGSLLHCDFYDLKKAKIKEALISLFPFSILFILYLVSLIWTQDIERGFKYIEHTLSFIIFPIVIFVFKPFKDKEEISCFVRIFIVSTFVFCILTLCSVFFVYDAQNLATRDRIEKTFLIGEHPIYFSLLQSISVILLIFYPFKKKVLSFLFIVVFISGIIVAATRGVFFALIISIITLLFFVIKNKKKIIVIIITLLLSTVVAITTSPLKERMEEFIHTEKFYPEGIHYNSFNIRMAIYKCSFSIIKEKLIIGYGPGDIQKRLNKCYEIFPTKAFTYLDYNTHNQYLHYLCAFGIIGTIIILYFFLYYMKIAWAHKNWGYFIFLLFFYLSFFTENILVRNTGIVVFTMFNCIFAYQLRFISNEKKK